MPVSVYSPSSRGRQFIDRNFGSECRGSDNVDGGSSTERKSDLSWHCLLLAWAMQDLAPFCSSYMDISSNALETYLHAMAKLREETPELALLEDSLGPFPDNSAMIINISNFNITYEGDRFNGNINGGFVGGRSNQNSCW